MAGFDMQEVRGIDLLSERLCALELFVFRALQRVRKHRFYSLERFASETTGSSIGYF